MVYSYSRGYKIFYINNQWMYVDNRKILDISRPCKKCGKKPTKEGYDTCLGKIKGVKSACCGHGVEDKYIMRGKNEK